MVQEVFSSQYDFNSQSSSQGSSQGSSQEPKVYYVKEKTETDGNDTEIENLTISETQECNETTQSTQDSCYSWSGVSQEIDIKGENRELSDDEEEPWWESKSTQKSTQSSQLKEFSSSQLKAEASSSQDDNKSDNEEDKNEDEKVSFYLKLGNYINLNI